MSNSAMMEVYSADNMQQEVGRQAAGNLLTCQQAVGKQVADSLLTFQQAVGRQPAHLSAGSRQAACSPVSRK